MSVKKWLDSMGRSLNYFCPFIIQNKALSDEKW